MPANHSSLPAGDCRQVIRYVKLITVDVSSTAVTRASCSKQAPVAKQ